MVLFKFRTWPWGPNLISAGLYDLAGWLTVVLFLGADGRAVPVRLPIRARRYK